MAFSTFPRLQHLTYDPWNQLKITSLSSTASVLKDGRISLEIPSFYSEFFFFFKTPKQGNSSHYLINFKHLSRSNNLSGLNNLIKLDNITGLNDLDSLFSLKKIKNCFHFTYCVIFLATGTSAASMTSTASRTSVTSMTSTASFHQKTWGT